MRRMHKVEMHYITKNRAVNLIFKSVDIVAKHDKMRWLSDILYLMLFYCIIGVESITWLTLLGGSKFFERPS